MARMAALSGGESLGHAMTTKDRSCKEETGVCVSVCVCGFVSGCPSGAVDRFESCRSDHLYQQFAERQNTKPVAEPVSNSVGCVRRDR